MLDYSRFQSDTLAHDEHDIEMQALSQALAQVRHGPLSKFFFMSRPRTEYRPRGHSIVACTGAPSRQQVGLAREQTNEIGSYLGPVLSLFAC